MRWQQLEINKNATYPYRFIPIIRSPTSYSGLVPMDDRRASIDEADRWCREQFPDTGRNGWFNERWSRQSSGGFVFRYEEDAFAFKMRWC